MAGINGVFAYNGSATSPGQTELLATRDHKRAHEPDGFGEWRSDDRRFALGRTGLSIIDSSERALQPIESGDGRFMIVL